MSIEISTLANGLRVVTERMDQLASASCGVWCGAGTRNETAAENGIAHFFEHMAFKGGARRDARQIAEAIEDVGGYLNAYTGRENTAYYARVLGPDVPLALDIIADILTAPKLAAADIEVERGVILQEIGQALDTPDDIIHDWAQEVSWPDQPFGRAILGTAERVSAFQQADLRQFIHTHYTADNLVVAAAGAVDHESVVKQVEAWFGHLTTRPRPAQEPARWRGGEKRQLAELEQAHVVLSLPAPDFRDPRFYVAQVYSTLLGGGMSSRLFQEIREKRGLCYTIYSAISMASDTGDLTIYAGTSGDQLAELLNVAVEQLRDLATHVTPAEVNRARAQIKAQMLMGLESPSARCERLGRNLLALGRITPITEIVERLDAVDVEAVRNYAGWTLTAGAPTLIGYGPVAAMPPVEALAAELVA